jgi:hypothetical protein
MAWITLAMARLTILQGLGNNCSGETSTHQDHGSIRVAIALCWDSIVPMDDPEREETSLLALASHELYFSPLTKDKGYGWGPQRVVRNDLGTASSLQGIRSTPFILDDNNDMLAVVRKWQELVTCTGCRWCQRFHRRATSVACHAVPRQLPEHRGR